GLVWGHGDPNWPSIPPRNRNPAKRYGAVASARIQDIGFHRRLARWLKSFKELGGWPERTLPIISRRPRVPCPSLAHVTWPRWWKRLRVPIPYGHGFCSAHQNLDFLASAPIIIDTWQARYLSALGADAFDISKL